VTRGAWLDALKLAEKLGDLAQNVNFAVRGDTVREAFASTRRRPPPFAGTMKSTSSPCWPRK
jgi:hypothetical protein